MTHPDSRAPGGTAAATTAPRAEPGVVLVLEDIHKRFGPLEVLRGVSVTAREHQVIAIIGASGSGKSTLLRCINLLEVPDAGRLWVNGEAIGLRRLRTGAVVPADPRQVDRIRTRIGMVFQSFNLWAHKTVLENVIEAPVHVLKQPWREAVDRGQALLEKVGIADKRDHYPAHLSGGQQQRAAIARALAMEPQLMLFDEPTSALDPELVGEVLRVIGQLAAEGRTMVIVTHEMAFAREVSSEVIFLHDGRIEEQGPPAEVFEQPRSDRLRQFLAAHLSHPDRRDARRHP
jgi:octopine/nopaline transport system ATP-binding protein